LCVLENLPPAVCNLLTGGVIGSSASGASLTRTSLSSQPQRGVLGLPLQPSADTQATQNLVTYLLR
jgi:hypothetical protein